MEKGNCNPCKEIPISPILRRSALGFLWKKWCSLKLQYCFMWRVDSLKISAGRDWGQGGRDVQRMGPGWHHWLDGWQIGELLELMMDMRRLAYCTVNKGPKELDTTRHEPKLKIVFEHLPPLFCWRCKQNSAVVGALLFRALCEVQTGLHCRQTLCSIARPSGCW